MPRPGNENGENNKQNEDERENEHNEDDSNSLIRAMRENGCANKTIKCM
jgi:hypothetical protein